MSKTARPAVNNSVLSQPTLVVRRLHPTTMSDPNTMEELSATELEQDVKEGQMIYFNEGWVANDHPRDHWMTEELLAGTRALAEAGEKPFGVARSDNGGIVETFQTLGAAESASKGARLTLGVQVDIDNEKGETISVEDRQPAPADWA